MSNSREGRKYIYLTERNKNKCSKRRMFADVIDGNAKMLVRISVQTSLTH